jgi:hypothetical protein
LEVSDGGTNASVIAIEHVAWDVSIPPQPPMGPGDATASAKVPMLVQVWLLAVDMATVPVR